MESKFLDLLKFLDLSFLLVLDHLVFDRLVSGLLAFDHLESDRLAFDRLASKRSDHYTQDSMAYCRQEQNYRVPYRSLLALAQLACFLPLLAIG